MGERARRPWRGELGRLASRRAAGPSAPGAGGGVCHACKSSRRLAGALTLHWAGGGGGGPGQGGGMQVPARLRGDGRDSAGWWVGSGADLTGVARWWR